MGADGDGDRDGDGGEDRVEDRGEDGDRGANLLLFLNTHVYGQVLSHYQYTKKSLITIQRKERLRIDGALHN